MKKFLVGAALAAMVCSGVSAQMEWHAAGNGIFVTFASKIGEDALRGSFTKSRSVL
jgi:hypothetical protein